jgi:23S rRNA-/tRNA-specific pseudouridylate synthase
VRLPPGPIRVLHRDAQLLVLDKPAGLPTTSPDGRGCLVEEARRLDPDAPLLHPSSRLDAEVTGVVTFARTRAAIAALLAARAASRYERVYAAIASRAPEPADGVWDAPIAVDPRDRRLRTAAGDGDPSDARVAKTTYAVVARTPHGPVLLALLPMTGRTHQLRVHAAAAGAPLVGDVSYEGPRRVTLPDGRVVLARRTMLHCARVAFPHPATGAPFEATSPAPADLCDVWTALGGDGRAALGRVLDRARAH